MLRIVTGSRAGGQSVVLQSSPETLENQVRLCRRIKCLHTCLQVQEKTLGFKVSTSAGHCVSKEWAATVYGHTHNQQCDKEDLDSPPPDHMLLHSSVTQRDITLHIHKAVNSIGLEWDISGPILDHPVVQHEYILLLLGFKGLTVPSKADFALFVQTHLVQLTHTVRQIDQVLFGLSR